MINLVFLAVSTAQSAPPPPTHDPLGAALQSLGTSCAAIRIDRVDLDRLTNRAAPGSVLAFLFGEPFQTKWFMQHVRQELLADLTATSDVRLESAFWKDIAGMPESASMTGSPLGAAEAISRMSRWGDRVVRRTLLGNPVADDMERAAKPDALADAVAALHARAGAALNDTQRADLAHRAQRLPLAAQRAAALVLLVADRAVAARDRAIRKLDRAALRDLTRLNETLSFDKSEESPADRDRLEAFELGHLLSVSQELAAAAHLAAKLLVLSARPPEAPPRGELFRWETPFGRVLINGSGADVIPDDGPYLLIVDPGGDDIYHAGGAACGLDNPVSVLIDVTGDDRYVTRERTSTTSPAGAPTTQPRDNAAPALPASRPAEGKQALPCAFGAGMLGIGILIDCAGSDAYEVRECGLGYGLFGVGLLDDWAGEDSYSAVSEAQAAAVAGMGLLIDRAGSDTYRSFTVSQAFAGVSGMAALIDLGGDDRYVADDTEIRFASAQSPQHNNSMCQAAAVGLRADYVDGYSLPGGVAILLDAAGNDEYSCGVFGQGTGYWLGAGFLIDAAGDDKYSGVWYVQGAAAHFALGALLDESGDDSYTATMATSQGTGHDLSLGFLADLEGNDVYRAAGLTMGSGNESGIGIVIDAAGDDRYETPPDASLGWVNAPAGVRATMPTVGLFLDAGGRDAYSHPFSGDGQRWGAAPNRSADRLHGRRFALGLDCEMDVQDLWSRAR